MLRKLEHQRSNTGTFGSVDECAFAWETGREVLYFRTPYESGACYYEHTDSPTCPEGYEPDDYNFYQLESKSCHEDDAFVIEVDINSVLI